MDHVGRLMHLLAVPGVTGEEERVGLAVRELLVEAGVPGANVAFDSAHRQIPLPTQTGNLIAKLDGRGARAHEPARLFMAHLDTVPLCAGALPRLEGDRIVNDARTALGGDNRTGCAVLIGLAAELSALEGDRPPVVFLMTVREESGLFGARHLNPADLGPVSMGFNFDGKRASDVIVGAVGADRWEVEVRGRASHAGVHPERGVSATLIFALALADMHAGGWFGRVRKDGRVGTSNVGPVSSPKGGPVGEATNVVTDALLARGESRSHDPEFVKEITAAYGAAFASAARRVADHEGNPGEAVFTVRPDYEAFRLADDAPVVTHALGAMAGLGMTPTVKVTDGGLDANWLNRHGIPVVTFGAGQNEIHTVNEWIDLAEFRQAVKLAVALATG